MKLESKLYHPIALVDQFGNEDLNVDASVTPRVFKWVNNSGNGKYLNGIDIPEFQNYVVQTTSVTTNPYTFNMPIFRLRNAVGGIELEFRTHLVLDYYTNNPSYSIRFYAQKARIHSLLANAESYYDKLGIFVKEGYSLEFEISSDHTTFYSKFMKLTMDTHPLDNTVKIMPNPAISSVVIF